MSAQKSRKNISTEWLVAVDVFCNSRRPNIGAFTRRTTAALHSIDQEKFWILRDLEVCVEEITGASARKGFNNFDSAVLKSSVFMAQLYSAQHTLMDACVQEGVVVSKEEAKARHSKIEETIVRRRRILDKAARHQRV